MPEKESPPEASALTALHALLGHGDAVAPGPVTAEALSGLTLRQLLDGAKSLGLTAVSKLKKEALVKAVLDAWHAHSGAGQAQVTARIGEPPAEAPEQAPPRSHKFEVGQPGRASTEEARVLLRESSREIPWGYGRDRVTAMPVDPDRLFAYWEVLDDSIAAARGRLGAGGPGAWLNLRVYDTTGRIFDGTNAHSFFDHRVERGDRQWFFPIGRPTSELIIEMGMLSHEGYFAKIARSGRVEFPRREPAPWQEPEWLTVRVATGQTEHAAGRSPNPPPRAAPTSAASATAPFSPSLAAPPFIPSAAFPTPAPRRVAWEDAIQVAGGGGIERHEWEEVHTQGLIEEYRQFRWDGPTTLSTWEAGPFPYPVEIPEPVREVMPGKTRVIRVAGRTHVVHGPWHVVIRGLHAQHARVVLSRWEVYRTWAVEIGHEVSEVGATFSGSGVQGGASERMIGASDRRWVGGSEVRLGGSSEVYFLKASELRLGGASERQYAGASELSMRGASEWSYAGGSELRMRGASERSYAGSSARLLERGFLGGSEGRLGPPSGAGAPPAGATSGGGAYPASHPSIDRDPENKTSPRGGS